MACVTKRVCFLNDRVNYEKHNRDSSFLTIKENGTPSGFPTQSLLDSIGLPDFFDECTPGRNISNLDLHEIELAFSYLSYFTCHSLTHIVLDHSRGRKLGDLVGVGIYLSWATSRPIRGTLHKVDECLKNRKLVKMTSVSVAGKPTSLPA